MDPGMKELVFGQEYDFPRRLPTRRYLVLSSPRTGSSMVTDGLYQTGLAGYPLEYLNERALSGLPQPLTHAEISRYLADVQTRRTSPNGVFGMKIHFHQFANLFLDDDGKVTRHGREFLASFSDVILCNRRDRISQAISYVIALDTGKWNSRDPSDERSSALAVDGANVMKILNEIRFLVSETRAWRDMIAMGNFNAMEVYYEDLVNDYQAEMDRVMKLLGIPRVLVRPLSVKLAGKKAAEAKDAFLHYIGAAEDGHSSR
jgi:trehalose 2-sulfotransferase